MKDSFIIRIGPSLKKALDIQKDLIKEVTYDIVNASDYEAGEIIADKLFKNKIL